TTGPSADLWTTTDISIVDVATAESTPLVEGGASSTRPLYSPDGGSIAFSRTGDPPRWFFRSALCIVPVSGGAPRQLSATFDEQPGPVGWTADGSVLLFQEPYRTTTRLYAIDVHLDTIETLYTGGGNADFNLNAARTWVGFSHQTPELAVEAFASPLASFAPR